MKSHFESYGSHSSSSSWCVSSLVLPWQFFQLLILDELYVHNNLSNNLSNWERFLIGIIWNAQRLNCYGIVSLSLASVGALHPFHFRLLHLSLCPLVRSILVLLFWWSQHWLIWTRLYELDMVEKKVDTKGFKGDWWPLRVHQLRYLKQIISTLVNHLSPNSSYLTFFILDCAFRIAFILTWVP